MTTENLLTIVGWTVTIAGLWATVIQLRRTARTERCRFLLEATDRYFKDTETRTFYYRLDYHEWTFDQATFAHSDEERLLDGIIYTFDVIGSMVRMGALTLEEVQILAFQATRVLGNPEVQEYLNWLDSEYERLGRPVPAHKDARELVEAMQARV